MCAYVKKVEQEDMVPVDHELFIDIKVMLDEGNCGKLKQLSFPHNCC